MVGREESLAIISKIRRASLDGRDELLLRPVGHIRADIGRPLRRDIETTTVEVFKLVATHLETCSGVLHNVLGRDGNHILERNVSALAVGLDLCSREQPRETFALARGGTNLGDLGPPKVCGHPRVFVLGES